MKNTSITLNQEAKRELAIIKYKLDASDYSDTILRLIDIAKKIEVAK
jgi:hypothetical protein